jgi:hypothetical protein
LIVSDTEPTVSAAVAFRLEPPGAVELLGEPEVE